MGIGAIVALGLLAALLAYAVMLYNGLVQIKHNVSKAWANIDVLLKQRHDELPKLVETCKQYMKFEQDTLTKVMEARSRVSSAREQQNIPALGQAEGALRASVGNLFAVAEAYPDLKTFLNEWKGDRRKMLERFDLNRDGELDLKEWELARLQAQREIRKQQGAIDVKPVEGVHLLRKPADGRLFLLAAEMPDKLGGRYRLWSWVHLAIFIGAGSAGLVML